jgi:hypothetical protein
MSDRMPANVSHRDDGDGQLIAGSIIRAEEDGR